MNITIPRPIGSFFEAPTGDVIGVPSTPGWESGSNAVTYVQTGRQALRLAAAYFGEVERRDRIVVPAYACESMLSPFPSTSWSLTPYPVDTSLRPDPHALRRAVHHCPERSVVITMSYFGAEPDDTHRELVAELRSSDVRVIEDETHRVLTIGEETIGDLGVASLRKTLPVSEGGYLRGPLSTEVASFRTLAPSTEHPGWEAMTAKRDGDLDLARSLFAVSESLLEDAPPARILHAAHEVLVSLDRDELARRRARNHRAVAQALAGSVDSLSTGPVPSHHVVSVRDPRRLQSDLANDMIFCPVHWPRPPQLPADTFPSTYLSLPIDHRYDEPDMHRIAACIQEHLPQ